MYSLNANILVTELINFTKENHAEEAMPLLDLMREAITSNEFH